MIVSRLYCFTPLARIRLGSRNYSQFALFCCKHFRNESPQISYPSISKYYSDPVKTFIRKKHYKSSSKKDLPYEVNTNVPRDMLIYSHMNNRFYKMFTYFGLVMFLFWTNLSWFAYDKMRDMPKEDEDKKLGIQRTGIDSWFKKWSFKEGIYKNGISVLCFSVGYMALFISLVYPLRSVHKLWLLKGGEAVKVTTYSVFGKTRSFAIPLNEVSCLQTRTSQAVQIPMKIKGLWFFFLLDKKGHFHNPELFDFSVGLSRSLK